MENKLIGKKVKGFKFEDGYNSSGMMDKYIGEIGTIVSIIEGYLKVKVKFSDGECWLYPLSEIKKHLVNDYPKVMIVSDYEDFRSSLNRVVFMEKNGRFLAWTDAENIEEAEKATRAITWDFAKDIEQKVKLTLQDISDGKGVGVPPHLIEII